MVLSESLTTVPGWAFEECHNFSGSLVIPNGVTSIGSSAFEGCHGFNGTLSLSKNLTLVNSFAFASCENFKDAIILAEEPPTLGSYSFGGFGSTTLMVPCGCVSAYENSTWYEQFTNIVEDCTAVAEAESQSVKVYPNPTQGHIAIEADNIQHIAIFNLLGEKVFESTAIGDAVELDLGGLEKGLYVIRIDTANEILTKNIMLR